MDFTNAIALLAPQMDPDPVLAEMRAMNAVPDPNQSAWSWTGPMVPQTAPPIPGNPQMVQQGPMAGASMMPGPTPAAPFSPQQLAAIQATMPHTQALPYPHAPAAGVRHAQGNIQLQPVQLPNIQTQRRRRAFGG